MHCKETHMPRKKTAPSDNITLRMPYPLQQDMMDILATKQSDYSDFTDFVIGACRKEVEYQKLRVRGRADEIIRSVGSP